MRYAPAGTALKTRGLYINGEWVAGNALTPVSSPMTGRTYGYAHFADTGQLDTAARAAKTALSGDWSRWTSDDRSDALHRLADLYRARQGEIAQTIMQEVGSPGWFCNGPQIDHPQRIISYYAAAAQKHRFSESRNSGKDRAIVRHVPVGAVGVITPWNMPQKTIMMKVAPRAAPSWSSPPRRPRSTR
jgi:aldehyde dehydrogenase (NAD+)